MIIIGLRKEKWLKVGNKFYARKKSVTGTHLVAELNGYGNYKLVGTVKELPKVKNDTKNNKD